jgi:oxygen-dependent protoporphyrinogen oxidase
VRRDAIVVGGGLSGLSAAHRFVELGAAPLVLEGSDRCGGWLGTVERDGFVIETGPDSILSEKRAALRLAGRLGLTDEIVSTHDAHRGAYVVHRGRLERVPEGFSLMAPTRLDAWMRSPIADPPGRLRAALEPLLPARPRQDESLASFVQRRFGREVLDRLAQPLVGGIYGGDPRRLSLRATMPRFVELERSEGSVLRGLRDVSRRRQEQAASGARYGLFVAFRRGMQQLVDALVAGAGEVWTRSPIVGLERDGRLWRVHRGDGHVETSERVVLALPAWASAELLRPHAPRLSALLDGIPHGSAATVTYAWPREAIPHPLDAFGFVVPKVERRSVLASTFSSVKWPGRAPEGQALLRVFLGGHGNQDRVDLPDEALEATGRRELRRLIGVTAAPSFALVRRYRRAMPQYVLGHRERVAAIEAEEAMLEGLALATNALKGVGIPDSIARAEAVAEGLLSGAVAAAAEEARPPERA